MKRFGVWVRDVAILAGAAGVLWAGCWYAERREAGLREMQRAAALPAMTPDKVTGPGVAEAIRGYGQEPSEAMELDGE